MGTINGEFKNCRVIEGKEARISFEHLTFSKDNTAAFMIAQTSSPEEGARFHSIVFFLDHEGKWKIESWHISK